MKKKNCLILPNTINLADLLYPSSMILIALSSPSWSSVGLARRYIRVAQQSQVECGKLRAAPRMSLRGADLSHNFPFLFAFLFADLNVCARLMRVRDTFESLVLTR